MQTLTKLQIEGLLTDVIKDGLGMPLAEAKKAFAELDQLRKAAETMRRNEVGALAVDAMPDAYRKKYAHAIKMDPLKGAGLRLGRIARAFACAANQSMAPEDVADGWGDKALRDEIAGIKEAQKKALGVSSQAAGGVLVPTEHAAEFIEVLRSASIVLQSGVRMMDLRTGRLRMGRQGSSATAYWAGESVGTNASQLSTEEIVLDAKKCTGITPISNELLRVESAEADAIVRDDLAQAVGLKVDLACIRGDGTVSSPRGVRWRTASANVNAMTASPTLTTVTNDLLGAWRRVSQANVPITAPVWWCEDRTKFYLAGLRDGNGNLAFDDIMKGGTLFGRPVLSSNQIPTNLGGGTETEVTFIEPRQWIYGTKTELLMELIPHGSYLDGTGAHVSATARDESVIRVITEIDFVPRHNQAAGIITGVTWGA